MRTARVYARVRIAMTPPPGDHRPALRVALGLAVPGVALLFAGRPDLMIYAVFGAVTGMYGRAEPRQRRVVHQSQARRRRGRRGRAVATRAGFQLDTMPTTRLIVVARITVPNRYDSRQCRSATARMVVSVTLVSDT